MPDDPTDPTAPPFKWPHAPVHRLHSKGAFVVTAGTYQKKSLLTTPARLDFFMARLFQCATEFGWALQAWAILPNHYHFIAQSPDNPKSLVRLINKLHVISAKELNRQDKTPGRKVWHQYWESHIDFENSYFARMNYVMRNPVHHHVVAIAENYRWCSAGWLQRTGERAFYNTIRNFPSDTINVLDDF